MFSLIIALFARYHNPFKQSLAIKSLKISVLSLVRERGGWFHAGKKLCRSKRLFCTLINLRQNLAVTTDAQRRLIVYRNITSVKTLNKVGMCLTA
jgi:hypothetical protein